MVSDVRLGEVLGVCELVVDTSDSVVEAAVVLCGSCRGAIRPATLSAQHSASNAVVKIFLSCILVQHFSRSKRSEAAVLRRFKLVV